MIPNNTSRLIRIEMFGTVCKDGFQIYFGKDCFCFSFLWYFKNRQKSSVRNKQKKLWIEIKGMRFVN